MPETGNNISALNELKMRLSNDSIDSADTAYENEYSLSIRISSDGFSLFVHDELGRVVLSQSVDENISQLSSGDIITLFEERGEIVFSDYSDVELVVVSDTYLFVPAPIFDPKHIDDYFQFQNEGKKDEFVLFNRVDAWSCVNIFSLPFSLSKALSTVFPETPVQHHLSSFLSSLEQMHEDSLHVLVREKKIDVVVLKEGIPDLINSFAYQTEEDLVYFTLLVFEQEGFDAERHKLFLYQKERDLRFKKLLLNYVKHCSLSIVL